MTVTKNLAKYLSDIGINLSELARKTGICYPVLYNSVGSKHPKRALRANELAKICVVIRKNPMDFFDSDTEEKGGELNASLHHALP